MTPAPFSGLEILVSWLRTSMAHCCQVHQTALLQEEEIHELVLFQEWNTDK
jgi:hypothetical protein